MIRIPVSFHFIFTSFRRVALQHSWFSRGPPLKIKDIYKLKIQSYNIYKKTEKVAQDIEKKIYKCCYAGMAVSFILNVGKV